MYGGRMICLPSSEICRLVTSGTTGERKRIAFSKGDIDATLAFFKAGMGHLSFDSEHIGIFMPSETEFGVGDLLSKALVAIGRSPFAYGPIYNYEDAATFCAQHQISFLIGIPSQIRRLALTCPELKIRAVLLSADFISHSLKTCIEETWGCTVYRHYGLTEAGLGCAVELPGRNGMYVRQDIFLEEEKGEILITTLEREAMPLIRYRTGDMGRLNLSHDLVEVFGRKTELQKLVPIYLLDEWLFSNPNILDFEAFMHNNVLNIRVVGDIESAAQRLRNISFLSKIELAFSSGEVTVSNGRLKRSVQMM